MWIWHDDEILGQIKKHLIRCKLQKISDEDDTLCLFDIAMENSPFIDDFPIKTSIYKGFSMAMLNNHDDITFYMTIVPAFQGTQQVLKFTDRFSSDVVGRCW